MCRNPRCRSGAQWLPRSEQLKSSWRDRFRRRARRKSSGTGWRGHSPANSASVNRSWPRLRSMGTRSGACGPVDSQTTVPRAHSVNRFARREPAARSSSSRKSRAALFGESRHRGFALVHGALSEVSRRRRSLRLRSLAAAGDDGHGIEEAGYGRRERSRRTLPAPGRR